ncbi:MAG TPA: hemin uptake protein HemP [Methylibium sp.]|nr:hemin uptake protein HemP [Methylibium sp.]
MAGRGPTATAVRADVAQRTPADMPLPPGAVPSAALLQGRTAVHIEHNGALYLLRATRLGKLILTK